MSNRCGVCLGFALALGASFIGACASNKGDSGGSGGLAGAAGMIGAMGGASAGAPAASAGGAPSQGGSPGQAGAAPQGGAPSTPAGQLMCGGKLCHGGGHCASDGSCPAFLGGCFGTTAYQTCDAYCSAQGFACVQKACSPDGSASANGVTSVTYAAANAADCQKAAYPDTSGFDDCRTPIGLTTMMGSGDQMRCCCKD